MKGCPTARSQPAVNPCLHLHISGKCLQADPYQRPRYPELKCVIELPTSAPVTLEVLLQAQRVPVLRSCHKTTEWLASKGRAGIEGSHHKSPCNSLLRPQFSAAEVMTRCCVQTWPTRACQKGGYLQRVESTTRVRKSALTNDKPEVCLQPLSWSIHQYIQGEMKEAETRLTHWASIKPILVYNLKRIFLKENIWKTNISTSEWGRNRDALVTYIGVLEGFTSRFSV